MCVESPRFSTEMRQARKMEWHWGPSGATPFHVATFSETQRRTVAIKLRLEPTIAAALRAAARLRGLTVSAFVAELLRSTSR